MNLSMKDVAKLPAHVRRAVMQQIAASARPTIPVPGGTPASADKKRYAPFDSKLERDYDQYLTDCGIKHWHHPIRLKIATGRKMAWYTPDFVITSPDFKPMVVEVKGHWREAARVRIKVAAGLYPWLAFVAVTRGRKTGDWIEERF